jgi:hypothetical protein
MSPACARTEPAYSPRRPIRRNAGTTSCLRRSTRCLGHDVATLVDMVIDRSPGKVCSRDADKQVRRRRPVVRRPGRDTLAVEGPGSAGRRQRGSVTAETAVAFPALVVVLAVALWGVSAAAAQVACVDAARAGARAAARGEPQSEVRAAVLRAAPPRAHVTLSHDPATARVVVRAEAQPPLKGLFPALKLSAQAIAATEPEGGTSTP